MVIEILLLGLLLLFWAYYEVTKQFDYFKKKGIPFAKPSFPFGSENMKKLILRRITFNKEVSELAENEFKGVKIFGYFAFGQPTWVINDEELAKIILIKDFDHFVDRRERSVDFSSRANAIVSSFLTSLKGEKWKAMRTLMSGVFTSGKLKLMTPHMARVGKQLEEHIDNILAGKIHSDMVDEEGSVEMKALFSMYTLDAIATTGFGIESNSFQDPDNQFRTMALTLLGTKKTWKSKFAMVKVLFTMLFPRLARLLGIPFFPLEPTLFFSNIIERTYKHRLSTGERRNDIIDLIIDEMNAVTSKAGKLKAKKASEEFESEFEKDAAIINTNVGFEEALDKELILVSNALLFFFAGFDTTSSGISLIVYNLAKHQDIQDRVSEEINTVLGDSDKIRFEKLQELKYMDMVINESFRYSIPNGPSC
jgi:cytochrome P450